jgi:hypothetical protein
MLRIVIKIVFILSVAMLSAVIHSSVKPSAVRLIAVILNAFELIAVVPFRSHFIFAKKFFKNRIFESFRF